MTTSKALFVDEAVGQELVALVSDAKEYVVFVSPYIQLWGHMRNAIQLATKRKVDIRFVVRSDEEVVDSDDMDWLTRNKVKVVSAERLHAKIYLNESRVLVSSMNLTESSTKNSLEIALQVTDQELDAELREYISERLLKLAEPVGTSTLGLGRLVKGWVSQLTPGSCIRCGTPIRFSPDRPLCEDCYDSWVFYNNPSYPEKVCHSCGKGARVSYLKPLCPACYGRLG